MLLLSHLQRQRDIYNTTTRTSFHHAKNAELAKTTWPITLALECRSFARRERRGERKADERRRIIHRNIILPL